MLKPAFISQLKVEIHMIKILIATDIILFPVLQGTNGSFYPNNLFIQSASVTPNPG